MLFEMKFIKIISVLLMFTHTANAQQRITRGFAPGEIYISSTWYEPVIGEERYDAIFFSDDNGQTLSVNYTSDIYSQTDMIPFYILRDKENGVLYNYYRNFNFHRSEDYGINWIGIDPSGYESNIFASGGVNGELYLVNSEYERNLYRSTDYGENYVLQNSNIPGSSPEVGTEAGEIYLIRHASNLDSIKIYFSNDYGIEFTKQCTLDTTIGGYPVMGRYQKLCRGTSPGEVYLVTWHNPMNFHVHYSTDYGQSFETRYSSEEFEIYYSYYFSAGISPGVFYMQYSVQWFDGIHTKMYIYYSCDTAKTFTVYEHLLDETVSVNEPREMKPFDYDFTSHPNPLNGPVSFRFSLPCPADVRIKIYDASGNCIEEIEEESMNKGMNLLQWNNAKIKTGMYFAVLEINGKAVKTLKLLRL